MRKEKKKRRRGREITSEKARETKRRRKTVRAI